MAAAQLGEWSWDAASDVLRGSARAAEIVGVPPGTAITRSALRRLVPPDESIRARREIAVALEQRRDFEVEFPIHQNDRVVWVAVRGRGLYGPTGGVTGMAGVALDVTQRYRAEAERKAAEFALRESEAKFRTLASHAPVGIFTTDARGDCVFVNEGWCAVAGLTPREAAGTGWARAIHPDDRARVSTEWYAAARDQRPFALEYRFLRPDGKVTWVQGGAVATRDAHGAVNGYIGTISDITERKAAEFALRESEKRFRTVASRAPVGIFMTNAQGDTIFVNDTWCAMSGMTAAQAQGHGWINAVHPDDRVRLQAGWELAVRGSAASHAEYRFLRSDGSVAWVQGSAVQLRDPAGRTTGYVGTVADITDRKLAEDSVRQQAQHLGLALAAANLGDWSWDPATDLLTMSARVKEIFGVTGEGHRREAMRALVHPDDAARMRAANAEAIATRGDYDIEYRIRRPSGEIRWVAAKGRGVYGPRGELVRMMGVVQDITERKSAEEALRENAAALRAAQVQLQAHATELERKVEERTASLRAAIVQMEEFSYSVSHDLRSPLRAMNAYAQALVEDYGPQLDETARGYLERIQRSSVRMEKLTYDVLSYSRVARDEVQLAPVDLERLLADLILQYAELQPNAADVEIRRPLLPVLAHEPSLGQCLGNLLTNAAKFVRPGERPRIRVATEARGDRVRIWVEDDGIGIPPQYHGALFQVFERLPTPMSYEGTGIGLAIVRKAAEKMGGACGVESDGVRGSRFWVELAKGQP